MSLVILFPCQKALVYFLLLTPDDFTFQRGTSSQLSMYHRIRRQFSFPNDLIISYVQSTGSLIHKSALRQWLQTEQHHFTSQNAAACMLCQCFQNQKFIFGHANTLVTLFVSSYRHIKLSSASSIHQRGNQLCVNNNRSVRLHMK